MKTILLIGELGEIVRSINGCLRKDFQVQLCSVQPDMIEGLSKIVKPDLALICQIGVHESDHAFFDYIKENMPKTPVLVITTTEGWKNISGYCESEQFDKLFRPITGHELVNVCHKMIDKGGRLSQSEKEEAAKVYRKQDLQSTTARCSTRQKIMIVDDSPLVLRNMKNMLEDTYDIFLAPSGEKALQLIPKKRPDLTLLDYEMPGLDGKATFEKMLQDEYMKTIPVIFLTSVAQKDQVYGVLKENPAGYILKPADKNRVINEISKVLG